MELSVSATQAKRDIDALSDKVDALVGEAEVNPDVGIAVLKGEDQPADVQDPESRRAGYPDRAGRRPTRAPRLIAGLLHKAQDLDAVGIIAAAFIGHRDTSGRPAEQWHTDSILEFSQMPRDRRLTDSELARNPPTRACPTVGDPDEGAHARYRACHVATSLCRHKELEAQGHEVRVSDLYADGWKSEIDRADFPSLAPGERLKVAAASDQAFTADLLTGDVKAEQEKLLWADAVILQFPLWWYTMPAILKGWVDRVYAYGFAYGVGEHSDKRWRDRFGEGTLAGKRAMLLVTTGGWEEHYSARGVNGPIDDLLFPINHGILYYPGFDVLPPFVVYSADRLDEARFRARCRAPAREDADARDHQAHPLSVSEWRRLCDPEHAASPRAERSGCDRLCASLERRRRSRLRDPRPAAMGGCRRYAVDVRSERQSRPSPDAREPASGLKG